MGFGDKIDNLKDQAVGKAKQAAGDATDNERLQTEGAAQEFDGQVGQKVEGAKDKVNDVVEDLKN
ncbi:CsbD family protein [Luteococcus sp. Sow4_B9]|uniref:CsbD family protein n=1 Tax=Luteococcus sp. Sow4_B9 TaxID=3438792 RepID=UPI003F988733